MPPGRDSAGRFVSGAGVGPRLEATISGDTSQFVDALKTGVRELATFSKSLTVVANDVNTAFNKAAAGGRLFSDAAGVMQTKVGNAFAAVQRGGNDMARTVGRSFASVGEGMARLGVGALGSLVNLLERTALVAAGMGAALVAAAGAATAKWAQFQTAFARVTTIVDKGTTNIGRLEDGVRSLARAYGVDAVQAVGALAEAIGSGIDPGESLTFLETATKAARAGFADLGSVVTVFTGILASYNMDTSEAARVSDILFQAVKVGRTTMDQLAGSLGQVAPLAAAAGVSLEETAAAVASLTVRGLSTSEAVSSLRAVIAGIVKPAEQSVEALAAIGASAADLEKVGLAEVMRRVGEATGGTTIEIAKLFRDVDAMKGAVVLAGPGLDDFSAALNEMANAAGSTDTALLDVMDTLQFRWDQVIETVMDTVRTVGQALAPFATELLEPILAFATRSATEVRALAAIFKENTSAIIAAVRAMGVDIGTDAGAVTGSLDLVGASMRGIGDIIREVAPYLAFFGVAAETAALTIQVAFSAVMIAVRSTGGVIAQVLSMISQGVGAFAQAFGADELAAKAREAEVATAKWVDTNAAAIQKLKDSAGDAAMEIVSFEQRFNDAVETIEQFGASIERGAEDVKGFREEVDMAADSLETIEAAQVGEDFAKLADEVKEATAATAEFSSVVQTLEDAIEEWTDEILAAEEAQDGAVKTTERMTGAVRAQRAEVVRSVDAFKQWQMGFQQLGKTMGDPIRLSEGFNGVGTAEQKAAARRARDARNNSAGSSLLGFQPRGSGLTIDRNNDGGSGFFGFGGHQILGFATGGRVPRDMVAQVHQREFVLPAMAADAIGPVWLERLRNLRPGASVGSQMRQPEFMLPAARSSGSSADMGAMLRQMRPSVNMPMTINIQADSRAPDLREQARTLLPEITRAARLGIGAGGPF